MIKFRAWDNECKVIREYDELKGLTLDALDASDFMLEQFTGLKDVNGKEIYEGDIVHVVTGDGYRRTGKVIFEQEQGCYMVDNGWDKYPFNRFGYERDTLEVLGDVHTNPELLKG